jgi:acetoacetyl-CoA synthetase
VNAVVYNSKTHDHLGKLKAVVEGLSSLEKVIVFPFVDAPFDLTDIPKAYVDVPIS